MTIEFNEAFMSTDKMLKGSSVVGFGASNRTPETSRVHKRAARSPRGTQSPVKGLSRACVSVVRKDSRTYEVFVKGSGALLGTLRGAKSGKGSSYSFKLVSEQRSHSGFPTQKAAIARMLEKI